MGRNVSRSGTPSDSVNWGSPSVNWDLQPPPKSVNWARRIGLVALLALTVLLVPAALIANAPLRAQPELLKLAVQAPTMRVAVIVQKHAGQAEPSVEAQVASLDGTVTKDLDIIHGFAAELPAGAVLALARSESVNWVSLDAPVARTGCSACGGVTKLTNAYDQAVGADRLWSESGLQGQGVTIAVVDSGVNSVPDLNGRIIASASFNKGSPGTGDSYGHGTHVSGIIAGNGQSSGGQYVGIAPKANLVNVKVSDDKGAGTSSDLVLGLGWVLLNKSSKNIRVVNISITSSILQSYNVDPIDAAVEILWKNGIVVVVSAGNNGAANLYPPANDPFAITVGASDDNGTPGISDDVVASFSAYGVTLDGFAKPDLVAPGKNIISDLAGPKSIVAVSHPDHLVSNPAYFRMSGTSMAAPVVSGAVALLLQSNSSLTPDQVKYRLKTTAVHDLARWSGYNSRAGAGYLDIYSAVHNSSTTPSNGGIALSKLLGTGVTFGGMNWTTVNWNNVNWNTVNWNTVNWNSDYWGN